MAGVVFVPARKKDLAPLGDVLAHSFGFPPGDETAWFERAGHENIRVLRRGERVVGGLLEIPMGQFFGGRSVRTLGVAGVGIAPDERGSGLAAQMMISMLREGRANGFPISTLYPASITLYRRAGYERAGAKLRIGFDPRMIVLPKVSGAKVNEVAGMPDELRAVYNEAARAQSGYLDRGPYVWARVVAPRGHVTKTFTVSFAGRVEGYVVISNKTEAGIDTKVHVSDLAAKSPRAMRAVLRLLTEYRSLATDVSWTGGLDDPFVALLPERHHAIELSDFFMVRIADPAGALTARGYPPIDATVLLELRDETMRENSGVYELVVTKGTASVTKTKTKKPAHARLTEHALAALYTGHLCPSVLERIGMLRASAQAKAALTALFAGPSPSMRDHF
jgi:predicted acetyltransferase